MNSIQFSVLMSVYKNENVNNLKEAIDSILQQTILPDEFVIVKDGQLTDELDECLDKYKQEYSLIKIIPLQTNIGLGKALNEGIRNCSYDYIARMDSDDISVNNRFEKQIDFLVKHPDCDVVGGQILEFDNLSKKDLSLRKVPTDRNEMLKFLKKRNPMNHVTVMFKKESVIKSDNYLDCPYFEDYYLWIRMLKDNNNFANLNEVLVKVRAGIEMTNRRGKVDYVKHIINFENKLYKLGFINTVEYLFNIIIRSIVAFIPNKLRYYVYQEKLRNETK